MFTYRNPILRGDNPDPSICSVGDDYYLVVSSGPYFPALPIYHSRNLCDWSLIGHCLTDATHCPLPGGERPGSIYTPTIRYHGGRFYVTCTNVNTLGNFLISSESATGPWSAPLPLKQNGIDPPCSSTTAQST